MQQVARATSQHTGQYGPRGVDMRHHVHIPNLLPHVVRNFHSTGHATNPRIGAEEINRSEGIDCQSDEPNDVSFATHIRRDGEPAYFIRHHFGAFLIEVGHDHASGAFSGKATTESAPDAVGAASYHHNFVLDFHLSVSTAGDRRTAARGLHVSRCCTQCASLPIAHSHSDRIYMIYKIGRLSCSFCNRVNPANPVSSSTGSALPLPPA